jgi:DNA repair exonuclease SbcCD nuclease subunit
MAIIPVGDPHNGLYVWSQECGADFDSDIARKLAIAAADRLIASSPSCSVAVFLLLGDVFHANDQSNQTPAHKHQLDVDSRFVRVIGVAIETYRHILLRMLERFPRVVVKLIPGNHDPQAIWALAYALHAYFANEPRVEVDLGPSKFWYFQFGKVLIGATHGDTVKPERLPGIMAADKPQEWGAATKRYWYTGHIHSRNAVEYPGVMWESFRTLAAQDAYAASHGYRSGRDMVLIVHHREHGEVERHRCDVGMVQ